MTEASVIWCNKAPPIGPCNIAGWPGERKVSKLELKVLADVIAARPTRASPPSSSLQCPTRALSIVDYPFTTLHLNLAWYASVLNKVLPLQTYQSPGGEGAGLGHLFLRHLQRTWLLLHVVDLAPFDEAVDLVAQYKAIVGEPVRA
jgi:GTP-binding protein